MKDRYPPLKRGPDGKHICRGCGSPIPPGRRTWCSKECYRNHCPQEAVRLAILRDKEICQQCHYDYRKEHSDWIKLRPQWDESNYHRLWGEWHRHRPSKPEYHHIIPFSEGGIHSPDNIMTLCHQCHQTITRLWRKNKNRERIVKS